MRFSIPVNKCLIAWILTFSCASQGNSQHLLQYKDGNQDRVHVIYYHQDTLKYHFLNERYTLRYTFLDSLQAFGATSARKGPVWDTLPGKTRSGLYWQYILFKGGKQEKALIIYGNQEILKYHPRSDPGKVITVPLDQVEFFGSRLQGKHPQWDTSYTMKGYKHYQHQVSLGIMLDVLGALIGTTGAIIISNASHTDDDFWGDTYDVQVGFGAFIATIGGVMFISGTAMIITGVPKMMMYKKKLHGFSFNMNCTPRYKEFAVRYQF